MSEENKDQQIKELKAQNGKSDTLSNTLIGRIVSLSRALRPYQNNKIPCLINFWYFCNKYFGFSLFLERRQPFQMVSSFERYTIKSK